MKELGIAKIITEKRREKGITQDELASYIGVSKASVSKWETGQSYPDITFLPQLAAYFNISVDYLIGYEPQMIKSDIKKLYYRLADDFLNQPFEKVYKECQEITHKYFSCFQLLYQMATLYLNHYPLTDNKELQKQVLEEVIRLCKRIISDSHDPSLIKDTMSIQAVALLTLEQPQEVFELLGDSVHVLQPEAEIIAQAYIMLGNPQKAIETMQIGSFQNMLSLLSDSIQLLSLNAMNKEKAKEILKRVLSMVDLFNLDYLHPNTAIGAYLTGAQVACLNQDEDLAIDLLNRYLKVSYESDLASLHGDDYFDKIDAWVQDVTLGTTPRNIEFIRKGLVLALTENPSFNMLRENAEFQKIVNKIKLLGGN